MSERSKPSAFRSPSSSAKSSLSHSAQLAERSASNRNAFICASLSSSARATGTQTTRIQRPGSEFEEDPKRGNAGQARRPSSKHHSARWLSRKESGTQHRWTSRPCHHRRRSGAGPRRSARTPALGRLEPKPEAFPVLVAFEGMGESFIRQRRSPFRTRSRRRGCRDHAQSSEPPASGRHAGRSRCSPSP